MRKIRKISFEELVSENRNQLLKDKEAMDRIEARLDQKRQVKAE
ncbi:FbpB family small basic protein [Fredinandcohnia sp. SECRCQ15]|uniref:FbpB family small basic protein n=1 Tax=Fredinandcohnia quinoae TaxID=2918902 RepID=A0AAW5E6P7_9BACI|nr:FbpB family small basic protein [Fredinandcohnia sp. SECRCQ15]MCH1625656.1 FbpB family small basic protein [Fredinandcohnia sp. SECRCQ15]